MNKKIIGISLFILIITSSIFGCSKFQENNDTNLNSIDKDSMNPISKDTAINILKAEYGDNILVEDKDIKLIGDLYFIDVYVEVVDSDDGSHETHTHRQSLGNIKIDKYTYHCKGNDKDLACLGIFVLHHLVEYDWFTLNGKEWDWISEKEGNSDLISRCKKEGEGIWQ